MRQVGWADEAQILFYAPFEGRFDAEIAAGTGSAFAGGEPVDRPADHAPTSREDLLRFVPRFGIPGEVVHLCVAS